MQRALVQWLAMNSGAITRVRDTIFMEETEDQQVEDVALEPEVKPVEPRWKLFVPDSTLQQPLTK